jgi:hypothetical protein
MRMLIWLVLAVAASALVTACATGPTTQQGPVTIDTQIDFTEEPFHGTFEVTEGADALGCSSGTFVDAPPDAPTERGIHKEFTCESGPSTGTFTAEFFPLAGHHR